MKATVPSRSVSVPAHERRSLLCELTLIYVSLVYEADQELDEDEMEAITATIREWVPEGADVDVVEIVHEAINTYVLKSQHRVLVEAVDTVGKAVPERQQEALLADLRRIAEADGTVCESERRMIRDLAHAWGLDSE